MFRLRPAATVASLRRALSQLGRSTARPAPATKPARKMALFFKQSPQSAPQVFYQLPGASLTVDGGALEAPSRFRPGATGVKVAVPVWQPAVILTAHEPVSNGTTRQVLPSTRSWPAHRAHLPRSSRRPKCAPPPRVIVAGHGALTVRAKPHTLLVGNACMLASTAAAPTTPSRAPPRPARSPLRPAPVPVRRAPVVGGPYKDELLMTPTKKQMSYNTTFKASVAPVVRSLCPPRPPRSPLRATPTPMKRAPVAGRGRDEAGTSFQRGLINFTTGAGVSASIGSEDAFSLVATAATRYVPSHRTLSPVQRAEAFKLSAWSTLLVHGSPATADACPPSDEETTYPLFHRAPSHDDLSDAAAAARLRRARYRAHAYAHREDERREDEAATRAEAACPFLRNGRLDLIEELVADIMVLLEVVNTGPGGIYGSAFARWQACKWLHNEHMSMAEAGGMTEAVGGPARVR